MLKVEGDISLISDTTGIRRNIENVVRDYAGFVKYEQLWASRSMTPLTTDNGLCFHYQTYFILVSWTLYPIKTCWLLSRYLTHSCTEPLVILFWSLI